MSTTYRASQIADVLPTDTFPSPEGLALEDPAVRTRPSKKSQLYLAFHYVLLVYLFMSISRISDFLPWFRVGLLMQPIMLVGLFLTKSTGVLWQMRSTRWLVAFTAWVGVCVPFSFWFGGSFWAFVKALQSLLLVAFLLAFLQSVRDVLRALYVVALASGVVAIVSFISTAGVGDQRQGLAGSDTLSDANFFALYLAVGLGLLCLTVSRGRGWLRLAAFALIPISLAAIARSGSRAGLITLAVGGTALMIFGSVKLRTVIVTAGMLGVLAGAFLLPGRIMKRFTTWLSPSGFSAFFAEGQVAQGPVDYDANKGVDTPAASTEARLYLLRRSLVMTAKHPLFGVGPDMFMEAEGEDAGEHGLRGAWHYTHNTYTQTSSETGILGFVCFVGALFGGYRGLAPIRRRGPTRNIREIAMFLQTSYLMLMVGAFFLTLGYGGLPYILIGLSAAFQLAVRRYVRETPIPVRQTEMSAAI